MAADYDYNDDWALISDAAKDFIDNLLKLLPDKRMTAKVALEHPWLSTKSDVNLLPQVRKNFKAKQTLKKAVLAVNMMNRLKIQEDKSHSPQAGLEKTDKSAK